MGYQDQQKLVQTQISDILEQLTGVNQAIEQINSNPILLNQPNPTTPVPSTPQSANQLRNGSFSHSVDSWNNAGATNDSDFECAWWYSHPDTPNVAMDIATYPTAPNTTLKSLAHTGFNPDYSIWNRNTTNGAGTASINQGYTLDAPIASLELTAQPSYTLYGVLNIAKISRYIFAPVTARLGCGIYARQNSIWNYLKGAFVISSQIRGTVVTPTSREYMLHVRTDRGFTVNSSVLTIASAPSDADFGNGAGVVLNWQRALNYGVLAYDLYRNTGGTYVLLESITNGLTTYIDNGSFIASAAGFPSADFTDIQAYTASQEGVLTNLAIDGVSPGWDTIPFAIRVPSNYDMSLTDASLKQWIRWNFSGLTDDRFDIRVTDGVTDFDLVTVTSAAGQFTSAQVGKAITITGKGITPDYSGTVDSYIDANTITVTPSLPVLSDGVDRVVTVLGGADLNATYTDLAHLSYGANAIFSFNAEDFSPDRGIPPVFPNGSNQGGTGTIFPEPGDGTPSCVWEDEVMQVVRGIGVQNVKAIDAVKGDVVIDRDGKLNHIVDIEYNVDKVWRVETENGFSAHASETHKFHRTERDKGLVLAAIKPGMTLLTCRDGLKEISPVTAKEFVGEAVVVKFKLMNGHYFLIGQGDWQKYGGISVTNAKPIIPDIPF